MFITVLCLFHFGQVSGHREFVFTQREARQFASELHTYVQSPLFNKLVCRNMIKREEVLK